MGAHRRCDAAELEPRDEIAEGGLAQSGERWIDALVGQLVELARLEAFL